MPEFAAEPVRPGPSYPAEGTRPRLTADPRRVGFADLVDGKALLPSNARSQSARSHAPNAGQRSDHGSEPARQRREAAAEREARATNDREPKSLDRERPEESRSAQDRRVDPGRDLGEPDGAPDETAAVPDDGAGTGQSPNDSSNMPRRDPFAAALLAESGLAQTGAAAAAAADPENPDGPDAATIPGAGRERQAVLAVAPGSAGNAPDAKAVEASGLAIPLAVPSKGKAGGTLLTGEQALGDEGQPAQPQGVLSTAEATPPGLRPGTAHAGAMKGMFAQGDNPAHALTDEKPAQQSQASGLAATGPAPQESALARNENPAVSAAGAIMPGTRGANATASAPSGPNTPSAAVPLEKLGVEIASHAQAGRRRFDIRLDPPELGHVHVRLDVDRDGHVTSRLVVDRAETLDLLRRDAPQLERALQDAGLKTDSQTMQFLLRDQGNGQENARQNSLGQPQPGTVERNAQADMAPTDDGRTLSRPGGLDIRV